MDDICEMWDTLNVLTWLPNILELGEMKIQVEISPTFPAFSENSWTSYHTCLSDLKAIARLKRVNISFIWALPQMRHDQKSCAKLMYTDIWINYVHVLFPKLHCWHLITEPKYMHNVNTSIEFGGIAVLKESLNPNISSECEICLSRHSIIM